MEPERIPRVVVTGDGPVLLPGPMDLQPPDGGTVHSERPVVAPCAAPRGGRYPFCDTSHRRRVRAPRGSS